MARVHGKNTNFSFNGVAIEDELNSVSMTATVPEAEITAFADVYQVFIAGKPSTNFEVSGSLDPSLSGGGDATIFDSMATMSGPKSIIYDPTGSGPDTNDPEYKSTSSGLTGSVCTSYSISLPVGGAATYSATFTCSGAVTRAVS